jgi:hypothetical protein
MVLFWLLTASLYADNSLIYTTSSIGSSQTLSLKNTGIYNHRLTWTGAGTRTTCTIQLRQSIDNVTYTDLISAQSCTTNGTSTTSGYANYVKISVTVITGSNNTVYTRYDGGTRSFSSSIYAEAGLVAYVIMPTIPNTSHRIIGEDVDRNALKEEKII